MPFVPELGMRVFDPLQAYQTGLEAASGVDSAFQNAALRKMQAARAQQLMQQNMLRQQGIKGYQESYQKAIAAGKKPLDASVESFVEWAPYFDPQGFRTSLAGLEGVQARESIAEARRQIDLLKVENASEMLRERMRESEERLRIMQDNQQRLQREGEERQKIQEERNKMQEERNKARSDYEQGQLDLGKERAETARLKNKSTALKEIEANPDLDRLRREARLADTQLRELKNTKIGWGKMLAGPVLGALALRHDKASLEKEIKKAEENKAAADKAYENKRRELMKARGLEEEGAAANEEEMPEESPVQPPASTTTPAAGGNRVLQFVPGQGFRPKQ